MGGRLNISASLPGSKWILVAILLPFNFLERDPSRGALRLGNRYRRFGQCLDGGVRYRRTMRCKWCLMKQTCRKRADDGPPKRRHDSQELVVGAPDDVRRHPCMIMGATDDEFEFRIMIFEDEGGKMGVR